MKRFRYILLPLILSITVLVGMAWIGILPRGTPLDYISPEARFVRRWHSDLQTCTDPSSAQALLNRNKEGGTAVTMTDGSWVAIVMEHSCCTGAGFNATLYVASNGETCLDPESCYCGWMPLGDEIYGYPRTNTADFLAAVKSNGKKITRL